MKTALLFPGQGSQYVGMATEFVSQHGACSEVMVTAENICAPDFRHIVEQGPEAALSRAAILQPAITVANIISLTALRAALPDWVNVCCCAGHSLGEYSALYAAGVMSLTDVIRVVERRGYFMEREGDRHPGTMRAILGLNIEQVEELLASSGDDEVVIANHNSAQQVVVSGSHEGLAQFSPQVQEAGGKVIALNVTVANHSPLVAGAVDDFARVLETVGFNPPAVDVYLNVTAERCEEPDLIRDIMARQIVSRVRWYEIITAMLADGVDTFIEVGPKKVLASMMRKIVPKKEQVTVLQVDSPDSLAACLKTLADSR
jgi:[acyl-carrier-protein] S-malonyltransferase